MPNTLINVSNRLRVTVEGGRVIRSSGGLVAALEGLPEGQYETKWIGWPGAAFPEEGQRQEIARKLAEEHGCVPVFLSQEEATAFYEGFFQFQHLAIAALPAQLSALRTCLVATLPKRKPDLR